MKKKFLASALAASMVGTMFASMPAFAEEESSSAAAEEVTSAAAEEESSSAAAEEVTSAAAEATTGEVPNYDDVWAEKWADVDTSEHVVINYMTPGDAPTNDATQKMLDELNEILTEKVNAELQIYYIGWTDCLSNYNLTLARMDGSVDLVGTATDWLDAWPNADFDRELAWPNAKNGAFLELDEEMLAKYAPVTYETVPQEDWDLCKYNDNIYLMPEDNYAQWTNHGFAYRLDFAKLAGLENGVHSWEDMTTYFKYVCEHKDELGIVTPWDSDGTAYATMAGGWVSSHSDFVAIDGLAAAALWGGTKDDLYTIVSPFYTDADMMVEFAKTMKEWDEMGVWKTDVLNNTSADNREDFKLGKTAAEQHHTQTWTDLVSKTPENVPGAEVGFFWFGEEEKNVTALNITHGAMAVSYGSENPERALMVYDLLRNDAECYDLINYGQKGVQWDVNDEGLRTVPESYNSDTESITTNFWWGRNDLLEIRDATKDWDKIDVMYKELEDASIGYPYGKFVANVDDIQSYINNIGEVNTNYMKQIASGKYTGTAEEIVAEYQQALKDAGMDIVIEELQKQLNEVYGDAE